MNEMKSNSDQIFSTFFFLCIFILQIKFHKDSSFRFMLLVYPFRLCFSSEAKLQVLNEQIGPRGTWTWKTTHLRAKLKTASTYETYVHKNYLGNGKHLQRKSMSLLTGTLYGCQINYLLVHHFFTFPWGRGGALVSFMDGTDDRVQQISFSFILIYGTFANVPRTHVGNDCIRNGNWILNAEVLWARFLLVFLNLVLFWRTHEYSR